MKTYNALSLETGRIKHTVEANGFDEAVDKISEKINSYALDSYHIEEASETQKQRELQTRWMDLQNILDDEDDPDYDI